MFDGKIKPVCFMYGKVKTCCKDRYIAPYAQTENFVICSRSCYDVYMSTAPLEEFRQLNVTQ